MDRITVTHLRALAQRLNVLTNSPAEPYSWDANGTHHANIGNFHINGAYGGWCLHRMMNESGGVTMPMGNAGHVPARELYDQMRAFVAGIEFSQGDRLLTLRALVEQAVARVELANKEGDPILSAWLPEAQAALAANRRGE